MPGTRITRGVNWNAVEEDIDLTIWNKLTEQFWIDTKIPLSNDIPSWSKMTELERVTTMRVLAGLTLLDTIQGTVGAVSMLPDARTPHEESVLMNIAFMECVHSKSYSSIFSTLCSSREIEEAFRWSEENEHLQAKASIILDYYESDNPLKRKAASTMLESFLFLGSFYIMFWWEAHGKLTNSADIIQLILRDETVHGYYIGQKFQSGRKELPEAEREELDGWVLDLLFELFEVEEKYAEELFDPLGITEDVKGYLRYQADKALMNLGYDPVHPEDTKVFNATIKSSLSGGSNHDFFSGSGSTYLIAKAEATTDEDWGDW